MVRAAPLSPDSRRTSIIAATLPLLRIYGREVHNVADRACRRRRGGHLVSRLSRQGGADHRDGRERVRSNCGRSRGRADRSRTPAARQAHHRGRDAAASRRRDLAAVLDARLAAPPEARRPPPAQMDDSRLRAALAKLFEPHRDEIRCAPRKRSTVPARDRVAGTHPRLTDKQMTPHEIVTLLLDGIHARDEEACDALALAPYLSGPVSLAAWAGRAAPARQHDRVAVPAEHQRAHHRQGRRDRRHLVRARARRDDARDRGGPDRRAGLRGVHRRTRRDELRPRPARAGSFITSASCRRARSASSARHP